MITGIIVVSLALFLSHYEYLYRNCFYGFLVRVTLCSFLRVLCPLQGAGNVSITSHRVVRPLAPPGTKAIGSCPSALSVLSCLYRPSHPCFVDVCPKGSRSGTVLCCWMSAFSGCPEQSPPPTRDLFFLDCCTACCHKLILIEPF